MLNNRSIVDIGSLNKLSPSKYFVNFDAMADSSFEQFEYFSSQSSFSILLKLLLNRMDFIANLSKLSEMYLLVTSINSGTSYRYDKNCNGITLILFILHVLPSQQLINEVITSSESSTTFSIFSLNRLIVSLSLNKDRLLYM